MTLNLVLDASSSDSCGSEVSVRGRPVDLYSLKRLLRRHGLDITGHGTGPGGKRTLRLTHAGGPGSPGPRHSLPGCDASTMPGSMRGPDELQYLEESNRIIKNYIQGSTEGGMWRYHDQLSWFLSDRGFEAWEDLSGWLSRIVEAIQYIHHQHHQQSSFSSSPSSSPSDSTTTSSTSTSLVTYGGDADTDEDGFGLLSICLDELAARILKDNDPAIIFYLLTLTRISTPSLRRTLTRHVQELADVVLGPGHPLALLWRRLARGGGAGPQPLARFVGAAVDRRGPCGGLSALTGPQPPLTPLVVCVDASYAELLGSLGDGAAQVQLCRSVIDNVRRKAPQRPVVVVAAVDILLDVARGLRLCGEGAEARLALTLAARLLAQLDAGQYRERAARHAREVARAAAVGPGLYGPTDAEAGEILDSIGPIHVNRQEFL